MRQLRIPAYAILGITCLLAAFSGTARAQVATLIEQCPELKTAAGSATDETGRAIAGAKDSDSRNRIQAAVKLGQSCDQRAVAALLDALKDTEPDVRIAAVEALGHLGDRSTIDPLIEMIRDKDWHVRMAVGRALCSFQAQTASYAALNQLVSNLDRPVADEGDMRARCATVLAINQLRTVNFSRKAILFLYGFMTDERPALREIAEKTALELPKTRNGVHELIGLLKIANTPDVKRRTATLVGRTGLQDAVPVLEEIAATDRDATVRQSATDALAMLKQKNQPGH
jgi:HEAT repeat protein